jgi:hypothetical protein
MHLYFKKNKFDYDLNDILSMLFHSRIIAPSSNLSSLESAQRFLEQPNGIASGLNLPSNDELDIDITQIFSRKIQRPQKMQAISGCL